MEKISADLEVFSKCRPPYRPQRRALRRRLSTDADTVGRGCALDSNTSAHLLLPERHKTPFHLFKIHLSARHLDRYTHTEVEEQQNDCDKEIG